MIVFCTPPSISCFNNRVCFNIYRLCGRYSTVDAVVGHIREGLGIFGWSERGESESARWRGDYTQCEEHPHCHRLRHIFHPRSNDRRGKVRARCLWTKHCLRSDHLQHIWRHFWLSYLLQSAEFTRYPYLVNTVSPLSIQTKAFLNTGLRRDAE